MKEGIRFVAIIPARYGSSRLPGKPLLDIGGKPMIQWVYERISGCVDIVLVATDDSRIYETVRNFGGDAVMTRQNHTCGTDRCLEAYLHYKLSYPYDKEMEAYPNKWEKVCDEREVVINIQGDEPFIESQNIEVIKKCFTANGGDEVQIATLVSPFDRSATYEDLSDPNTPKVVCLSGDITSHCRQVLMFSRSVIPYIRNIPRDEWVSQGCHFRHIGMYAYKANTLASITKLKPSYLEKMEMLEQLRWLENGFPIHASVVESYEKGIDTEADLLRAREKVRGVNI